MTLRESPADLRNDDGPSCSRGFALTRADMAVPAVRREQEWSFSGDGRHRLRVRYTGERLLHPEGTVTFVSRERVSGGGPQKP
ncbi:hypothetical protein ACX9I7_28770 [Streptomyces sp. L500]